MIEPTAEALEARRRRRFVAGILAAHAMADAWRRVDRRLQLDAVIFHRLRAGRKDAEHRPRRSIHDVAEPIDPDLGLPCLRREFQRHPPRWVIGMQALHRLAQVGHAIRSPWTGKRRPRFRRDDAIEIGVLGNRTSGLASRAISSKRVCRPAARPDSSAVNRSTSIPS